MTASLIIRRLQCALLAQVLLLGGMELEAQSRAKQVLVLQSLARGNLTLDQFTTTFRASLDRNAVHPLNVAQVVVDPTGIGNAPEEPLVGYIRAMYAGRTPPDLVVTIGGPAALFTRKHRDRLFPDAPALFAALDERYLRTEPLDDNESAVPVANNLPALIDDILQILPDTKHIFVVTGSGPISRFMRPELEAGFARLQKRVTIIWSNDMSFPDILRQVAHLPAHSAIIFQTFGSDAVGATYPAEQVVAALHASANAPLFSAHSPYLGRGMVGGSMMDIDSLARRSAGVAVRMLDGEPPARLRVPAQYAGVPTYDWRELRRWNIPESRLPAGSMVKFRTPSLWSEHKLKVVTALGVLAIQTFLISLLLLERTGRRRAELESRRNLALAADANRREAISALTTSIGHELGQPISAIEHNTEALQMMINAGRASPQATEEILADILSEAGLAKQIIERHRAMLRSHELQKRSIDMNVVIEKSVALVAHDLSVRQIRTMQELSPRPCIVDGDPVLLQQVMVNLLRNAIDALPDDIIAKREIAIHSVVKTMHVQVTVRDTGHGLSREAIGSLFTPFVTTKAHGLGIGLAITQRIVEAHAGTISADGRPGAGAAFTISLPRSLAAETSVETEPMASSPERAQTPVSAH